MPRSVILPVTALIALALFNPAVLAEDGVKIDPRVKGVEEQLERESKPVDIDAKRAKEAFVAAYQKECKARVKVFESAIAACEKKIKSAKSASDTKSEAALTAKLEELKVELETWKGNEGKKWGVKLEEEGAEKEGSVAEKNTTQPNDQQLRDPKNIKKLIAGKWKRSDMGHFVVFDQAGKCVEITSEGALLSTGRYEIDRNGSVFWQIRDFRIKINLTDKTTATAEFVSESAKGKKMTLTRSEN